MAIILFINILCTGIVLSVAVLLLIFGSKVLGTIFHGLFWLVIFLYLFFLTLKNYYDSWGLYGIIAEVNFSHYIHFFIPLFYLLFFLVVSDNKFRIYYLLFFIIGFVSLFFKDNIGQENVFYDILERKNAFLGYKNKKFKKSKN